MLPCDASMIFFQFRLIKLYYNYICIIGPKLTSDQNGRMFFEQKINMISLDNKSTKPLYMRENQTKHINQLVKLFPNISAIDAHSSRKVMTVSNSFSSSSLWRNPFEMAFNELILSIINKINSINFLRTDLQRSC